MSPALTLEGKRLLVTGATGGLGLPVVRGLVREGALVAAAVRDLEAFALTRVREAWGEAVQGVAIQGDWTKAAREAAGAFAEGVIDSVVVLTGGFESTGAFADTPLDQLRRMIDANLLTAASAIHAALPFMAPGGSIVLTGAQRGESLAQGALSYAVAKAAVHAFARGLARETAERGIRVNAILPSTIDTAANRIAMPGADVARWTTPDAIARVIVFLLSDDSRGTTGALIPV
jgi:NAD(P)-dependent dehydrogenase (short-subunit alcohol dehydrogenase family)